MAALDSAVEREREREREKAAMLRASAADVAAQFRSDHLASQITPGRRRINIYSRSHQVYLHSARPFHFLHW